MNSIDKPHSVDAVSRYHRQVRCKQTQSSVMMERKRKEPKAPRPMLSDGTGLATAKKKAHVNDSALYQGK
jgi:hypothetical protein